VSPTVKPSEARRGRQPRNAKVTKTILHMTDPSMVWLGESSTKRNPFCKPTREHILRLVSTHRSLLNPTLLKSAKNPESQREISKPARGFGEEAGNQNRTAPLERPSGGPRCSTAISGPPRLRK
jgi:hypothetical protein